MKTRKDAGTGKKWLPEYRVWVDMKARCFNVNNGQYHNYGARGISVCERWRNSFANFHADMGPRPGNLHSIDRIDNDGNYEPSNCRWTTQDVQAYNRRLETVARKRSTTGVLGVSRHGNRYQARVTEYGLRKSLGVFDTVNLAQLALASYKGSTR